MRKIIGVFVLNALLFSASTLQPLQAQNAQNDLCEPARDALKKSVTFYRTLSAGGGYLWWYAEDGSERAGEVKATPTQIWVQPPGTPSVGAALLRAYIATGDGDYYEAALQAGMALVHGQMESGGWDYSIDFDEAASHKKWYLRSYVGQLKQDQIAKRRNMSVFDDNVTQSALRFLMELDQTAPPQKFAADERLAKVRDAVQYALAGLLRAQYPSGAFPQAFDGKEHDPAQYPILNAHLPDEWPREHPKGNYWFAYTLNDYSLRDIVLALLDGYRRYGKTEYLDAAKRAGDFLVRAQLPEPQPVWAQQYNFQMEPIWARKFEPPAAVSAESNGAMTALLELWLETGDEKYWRPLPSAAAWFERSRVAPNLWSRFYELKTNKPLYFTKDYQLTFSDADTPTHYTFQAEFGIPTMLKRIAAIQQKTPAKYLQEYRAQQKVKPATPTDSLKAARRQQAESRTREAIAALDEQGRWVKNKKISSDIFLRNTDALLDYLENCDAVG